MKCQNISDVGNSAKNLQGLSKEESRPGAHLLSVKLRPTLSFSQNASPVFLVSSTVAMMLIFREQVSASASSQGAHLITVFEQDALEGQNCTQKQSTLHKTAFQNHF